MESKSGKNLNGVIGILGAVAALVTAVSPLTEKAIDRVKENSAIREDEKVTIPKLYKAGFPIKIDDAEEQLKDLGLKTIRSELRLKNAKSKYKDCFDGEVLGSSPKQGSCVRVGATVILKYITAPVIAESVKLFEEAEEIKAETRENRLIIREGRREQRKEFLIVTTDKAKKKINKMFRRNEADS